MRSPCLINSMSMRRASGLRSSVKYFSQYFGECASVRIWSRASVSAARSPFFAASRRSLTIFWPLMRDGGFFAMPPHNSAMVAAGYMTKRVRRRPEWLSATQVLHTRSPAPSASSPCTRCCGRRASRSAELDLVVLAVRLFVHGLHDDLDVERRLQPRQALAPLVLEVGGQVGVDARHDFVMRGLGVGGGLRLDGAIDFGGERLVGFGHAAAATRGTRHREQRAQILADPLARHLDQAELRDLQHVRPRLVLRQRALERLVHLLAMLGHFQVD